MAANAYETYLESKVMNAGPLELVQMLYQGALDAVRGAKQAIAAGDIAGRSKRITKAQEIIFELSSSIDRSGGDISARLIDLYTYMQRRLAEANVRQQAEPLIEIEGLLMTLLDGWKQCMAVVEQRESGDTESVSVSAA